MFTYDTLIIRTPVPTDDNIGPSVANRMIGLHQTVCVLFSTSLRQTDREYIAMEITFIAGSLPRLCIFKIDKGIIFLFIRGRYYAMPNANEVKLIKLYES